MILFCSSIMNKDLNAFAAAYKASFDAQVAMFPAMIQGEVQAYITRGLSTNSSVPLMPFRLFNSPEISVLTLTSTLPENMLEAGK